MRIIFIYNLNGSWMALNKLLNNSGRTIKIKFGTANFANIENKRFIKFFFQFCIWSTSI